MSQDNGKDIFSKLGSLFGTDSVPDSTGKTTAQNTQQAFEGVTAGLGSMLSGSGIGQQLSGLLGSVKSLNPQQIESILGVLKQSGDPKVQEAAQDLQQSQHDGETFVQKLQGYASSLTQVLPKLLPLLEGMLGKK